MKIIKRIKRKLGLYCDYTFLYFYTFYTCTTSPLLHFSPWSYLASLSPHTHSVPRFLSIRYAGEATPRLINRFARRNCCRLPRAQQVPPAPVSALVPALVPTLVPAPSHSGPTTLYHSLPHLAFIFS